MGLLRNLLNRLNDHVGEWYDILHARSLTLAVLSHTHHALRSNKPEVAEVIQAGLSLCLTLSKNRQGCDGILASDLGQLLWLPLSSINRRLDKEWIGVFDLALQLALGLLRSAGQHALENGLNVVALLQDQLTDFLNGSGLRDGGLEAEKMQLTSTSAELICTMGKYYRQWQLMHPASLTNFYMAMARLLHASACLLIRPSLMAVLLRGRNSANSQ